MTHRIEVAFKPGVKDALGERTAKKVHDDVHLTVNGVRTVEIYLIEDNLNSKHLDLVAKEVFADAIVNDWAVDRPIAKKTDFDYIIEVGYLPGVTDNVGHTAKEAIEDAIGRKLKGGVFSARQYLVRGIRATAQAEAIVKGLLANPLIERWQIKSSQEWDEKRGFGNTLPTVRLEEQAEKVKEVRVIEASDDGLAILSRNMSLALSRDEMKVIRDYFALGRVRNERKKHKLPENPTDVELEAIAQTWSEHCKHKIFNAQIEYDENGKSRKVNSLFKTYVRGATAQTKKPWLVSVFTDNAGIIEFNDEWNLAVKVETHNAPSALDPYGGALTGIVGVNRDIMGAGLGAKLLFNTDVFCFAPPDAKSASGVLPPKRIAEGVRKGVADGGNKTGVPTVNGAIVFDERFLYRPLVYCGTGGMLPKKAAGRATHKKEVANGDLIVMVGGRIGKDGIHGATMSSMHIDAHSPASAVQLGDPITQKRMADFLLEARDAGLYTAITDNGAGGLSSSVGEMAQLSGGFELHLEKAPAKYAGLLPWEILVSEAQERMTVAVPPAKMPEFEKLAAKHGVEATALGKFTKSGKFHCLYNGKTVALLDMAFLHEGVPQLKLRAKWSPTAAVEAQVHEAGDLTESLKKVLARYNVCSKEYVVRQYDHEVQGGSVVKPLTGAENDGPSDAGVLRPILSGFGGIAVANGICPKFGDSDAYVMAANAVDEAARNCVAVGGNIEHMAALDNFSWCDPLPAINNTDAANKLGALIRACEGLHDACVAYGIPLISGKDSMKNDFIMADGKRKSIPPTLLVTAVAKVNDVRKAVTMDVKKPGDVVYIAGETRNELGASEYYAMQVESGGKTPVPDFKRNLRLYKAMSKAIAAGLVRSCHDASDGGLAAALAESAFAGGLGLKVDLKGVPRNIDIKNSAELLFSESAGRFVITVAKEHAKEFEKHMAGNAVAAVGGVTADGILEVAGIDGSTALKAPIAELKQAWQGPLGK
jgi:phosphoribosylformylglycinamidine synthase